MTSHTRIDTLLSDIGSTVSSIGRPMAIMEVCGTHTMAIHRHGLAAAMPSSLALRSGPGCPVCVTPSGYIDLAISLAKITNVVITTFGDMIRVPGSSDTLESARASGCQVRVVQSPLDAVDMAQAEPDSEVVFLAVGFETTAPTIAAAVLVAQQKQVSNFSLLTSNKVVPPALHALLAQPELGIDALLLPGHVSAVIGTEPYMFIPRDYDIPCVVAGFEPGDIVIAVKELLDMIRDGRADVKNCYKRVVRDCGNEKARTVMDTVFETVDDTWRGFGLIPSSGLGLRPEYRAFDACAKFETSVPDGHDPPGCRCGDVVRGLIDPIGCGLFGTVCTPEQPVGPCMVSSEGTCAAHFKYGSGTD